MAEQEIFEQFCAVRPHEMHGHDPERFWQYFHRQYPNMSREKMVELLHKAIEAYGKL